MSSISFCLHLVRLLLRIECTKRRRSLASQTLTAQPVSKGSFEALRVLCSKRLVFYKRYCSAQFSAGISLKWGALRGLSVNEDRLRRTSFSAEAVLVLMFSPTRPQISSDDFDHRSTKSQRADSFGVISHTNLSRPSPASTKIRMLPSSVPLNESVRNVQTNIRNIYRDLIGNSEN